MFRLESDADLLENLSLASQGYESGWAKLLGPQCGSLYREMVVESHQNTEDVEIPMATDEDRLLNATSQLTKGSVRKASTQLTSLGRAPDLPRVRAQLRRMNPESFQEFQTQSIQDVQQWNFTPSQVKKQIFALQNDSAPGPSGLSVRSLKVAGATEEGLAAITKITNRIVNGTESNRERLTQATLVPLVKDSHKIRPIAIGETLTRLAARILLKYNIKGLAKYFEPHQMGVKQPGGVEYIIHSVRKDFSSGASILSLDLSNAFNQVSREEIRKVLSDRFPGLLPYFLWAYGNGAPLWYSGDCLAFSNEGVRQGDPLGPPLFALAIHPILLQLDQEFPQLSIYAYLDDVTVTGEAQDLLKLVERFRYLVGKCGLTLNENKSVLCLASNTPTPHNVGALTIKENGISVLGSPIGTPHFENSWCLEKVRDMKKTLLLQTETVVPVQQRYLLLKECVIPSITYLLRTVPPHRRIDATTAFDNDVEDISRKLLGTDEFRDGCHLSECDQLYLPLKYGGLGITKASWISEAAYLSSRWEAGVLFDSAEERSFYVQSLRDRKVQITEEDLKEVAPRRKMQKELTDQILKGRYFAMLEKEDEDGKARITASQEKGANDWLQALPNTTSKYYSDRQWRVLVRMRLGLQVACQRLPSFCPLCGGLVENFPHHALTCSYSEMKFGRDDRHAELRDLLISGLSVWGIPVDKEPKIRRADNIRGDLQLPHPTGTIVVDTSVVHPSAVRDQQNLRPTAATNVRERLKCRTYDAACRDQHKSFVPFVMQTFGGFGSKALLFLSDMKSRPPCYKVHDPGNYIKALRMSLCSRVMKKNCNLILRWLQLVLPPQSGGVAFPSE